MENVKKSFLRKRRIEIDNDILSNYLIESPLNALNVFTVGVTKFVLTELGIIIDVVEPGSAIKSIVFSPNLAS